MDALTVENELREAVSRIVSQVELASKQGRLDINLAMEDAFIPILKELFHLQKLHNLNAKQKNYPGIDLGDEYDRVAFQVTATTDLEKVKKTFGPEIRVRRGRFCSFRPLARCRGRIGSPALVST